MKLKHIVVTHFLLTFAALVGCFVWLGVTNAGNPPGRRGTLVTYEVPVYWILIGIGQMFIGTSVYLLISRQPGYVIGQGWSRTLGGSRITDALIRLIPAMIGLTLAGCGVIALLRE